MNNPLLKNMNFQFTDSKGKTFDIFCFQTIDDDYIIDVYPEYSFMEEFRLSKIKQYFDMLGSELYYYIVKYFKLLAFK